MYKWLPGTAENAEMVDAQNDVLGDASAWLSANPYDGQKNSNDYEATIIQKVMDQQFNAAEAQKNRDWNADQNARKYQIAMADLKAAGVNPYYLFSQGGTATSASGGSAATSSGSSVPSGSKAGQTALAAGIAIAKLIATIAAA